MAQRIRAKYPDTGLILFSYFNVMMNYGLEALAAKLEQIGVDGILAVDAPYEESGELKPLCAKHHLHLIPLVSPTTGLARAEMIMRDATGFVYYVTVRGVTGERSKLPPELAERLAQLRSLSPVPVVGARGGKTCGRRGGRLRGDSSDVRGRKDHRASGKSRRSGEISGARRVSC